MSVYEFGDAHAVVRVSLNQEGWEWFCDLCRSNLSVNDGFLKDVEVADAYLTMTAEGDDE